MRTVTHARARARLPPPATATARRPACPGSCSRLRRPLFEVSHRSTSLPIQRPPGRLDCVTGDGRVIVARPTCGRGAEDLRERRPRWRLRSQWRSRRRSRASRSGVPTTVLETDRRDRQLGTNVLDGLRAVGRVARAGANPDSPVSLERSPRRRRRNWTSPGRGTRRSRPRTSNRPRRRGRRSRSPSGRRRPRT